MKILRGKHGKAPFAPSADTAPVVVLDLSAVPPPAFEGFSFTPEEGQRLARRCFTEIPGLGPLPR